MNSEITAMKKRPGKYAIAGPGFPKYHGLYFLVEVDEDHNVHQLNPAGERDGILSDDGWHPYSQVYAINRESNDPKTFVRFVP